MNGWLLDTNVIAEVRGARPDANVLNWFAAQPEHLLFLSVLTFGEYRKGLELLPPADPRRVRVHATIAAVETRFSGRALSLSDNIVMRWGAISGETKRLTGHPPPVIDTLIAATAIENNLYLATRNVDDVRHSGAAIFNPWIDDPKDFPI